VPSAERRWLTRETVTTFGFAGRSRLSRTSSGGDVVPLELMAVVLFSGFNKLMDGLQVEPDEKPWYG
jgi:hypothetical protein